MTFSGSGADFNGEGDITWQEPFKPSNVNMPENYGSGSQINFEITLTPSFHQNADGFTLYRKSSLDTSWTEVEDQNIQSQWRHTLESADSDYPAWTYFPDKTSDSVTLNQGESTTILCDGTEVQIVANSITDSSPGETTIEIGGTSYTLYEGEYAELSVCNGVMRVEEIGSFPYVELQKYFKDRSPNDGSYRYRAEIQKTDFDRYYSRSIYADVYATSTNAPYIKNITYEQDRIFDFKPDSGLKPGGTIYVAVKEYEGDDYRVTLEDRTGIGSTDLHRANVTDGNLENTFDVTIDLLLDPYFNTDPIRGQNSAIVPLRLSREALQQSSIFEQGGTYEVGFRINEIDEGTIFREFNQKRDSPTYNVTTDGTSFAPNITSVEASADCSSYQEISNYNFVGQDFQCIRVKVTDSDDEELFVDMNLTAQYDEQDFNSYKTLGYGNDYRNGDYYVFNLSNIDVPLSRANESGKWTASFQASDGINSDNETVSWSVPWGDLSVVRESPSSVPFSLYDNETFINSYSLRCGGGPECVNQNRSVTLAWDPKPVTSLFQVAS